MTVAPETRWKCGGRNAPKGSCQHALSIEMDSRAAQIAECLDCWLWMLRDLFLFSFAAAAVRSITVSA